MIGLGQRGHVGGDQGLGQERLAEVLEGDAVADQRGAGVVDGLGLEELVGRDDDQIGLAEELRAPARTSAGGMPAKAVNSSTQ